MFASFIALVFCPEHCSKAYTPLPLLHQDSAPSQTYSNWHNLDFNIQIPHRHVQICSNFVCVGYVTRIKTRNGPRYDLCFEHECKHHSNRNCFRLKCKYGNAQIMPTDPVWLLPTSIFYPVIDTN